MLPELLVLPGQLERLVRLVRLVPQVVLESQALLVPRVRQVLPELLGLRVLQVVLV